jgi:hypothetical protein
MVNASFEALTCAALTGAKRALREAADFAELNPKRRILPP